MRSSALMRVWAAAAAVCLPAAQAVASDVCDRACLEGMVDRYMTALVAHTPEQLPLGQGVRFTENGQELRLGDGLWGTASAQGRYKLYVADPDSGQVGFNGTVFESEIPVLMTLRLRVEYGLITEIETLVARGPDSPIFPRAGKAMEDRGAPRPQFLRSVPPAERMSREQLAATANSYFTGLGGNTGRNTAPFAPTCVRLENGTQTNNNPNLRGNRPPGAFNIVAMSCEEQQKSGAFAFVTSIRNRRFPVIDRERGLVLAFAFFEHNGRLKEITLPGGRTIPSAVRQPLTYEITELFQIDKGRIDQIEAVLNTVPYGMRSAVWDTP